MKKQTYIARLKDNAGNIVTFERFSCKKAETVKAQLLKVWSASALYRTFCRNAEIVEVYATPDGYNTEEAPTMIFKLETA